MYGRPIRELRFVQIGYIVVAVLTVVVSIYVDSRGGGIYPERSLERTAPGKSGEKTRAHRVSPAATQEDDEHTRPFSRRYEGGKDEREGKRREGGGDGIGRPGYQGVERKR
jgi:hypothetical protein